MMKETTKFKILDLFLFIGSLFILVMFLYVTVARGEEIPVEPAFSTIDSWEPHNVLGVVLVYPVEGGFIRFAHPVYQVSQAPECRTIREVMGHIYLTTGGDSPVRYELDPVATMWQGGLNPNWQPMVIKTGGK